MFKSRGGVHYIRKVFNWERTQHLSSSTDLPIVMFVNMEMSKEEFEVMCAGNYAQI